jgi:WD40 repeat protein
MRPLTLCVAFLLTAISTLAQSSSNGAAAPPDQNAKPELVMESGHHKPVMSIAFGPDSQWLVSASQDTTLKLWDLKTGRELRAFAGHPGMVEKTAVTPDGRTLISAATDGAVKTWDIETGRELSSLGGRTPVWALALSLDGGTIAAGSKDGLIRVWPISTTKKLKTLHESIEVTGLAFGGNAEWLAASVGKNVDIWKLSNGEKIQTLAGHQNVVLAVAASRDGRWLASCDLDGSVKLWDTNTWHEIHAWPAKPGQSSFAVTFNPDGTLLAAVVGTSVEIWESKTGRAVKSLPLPGNHTTNFAVSFSPNGHWLAAGSDNRIALWDASNWRQKPILGGQVLDQIRPLARAASGKTLALGSSDHTVRLWDLAAGQQMHVLTGHTGMITTVAMSPDSRWLASAAGQPYPGETKLDATIRIWNSRDGQLQRALVGHINTVNSVAFSPDGKLLASGSSDKTIKLWDPALGRELRTLAGHTGEINTVAFSPDGRILASGAGVLDGSKPQGNDHPADKTIKLWDVSTGREIRTLVGSEGEVTAVAFSPDGRTLASSSGAIQRFERGEWIMDRVVRLWDVETGRVMRELPGLSGYAVAFSPDGRWLASAGGDVKVWELATGREVRTIHPPSTAWDIAFSADGRWIFTTSEDSGTRVWDPQTGELMATLVSLATGADWLVISPNGLFDGSPRGWQRILWRFQGNTFNVAPVEVFLREYYHPGLLAEILAGRFPQPKREISQVDRRQPQLELSLEAPAAGEGVSNSARSVTVKINVQEAPADSTHRGGSGVRDVRLSRNGSLVRIWHGEVLESGKSETTLEATISAVAGEQHLVAYAFNHEDVKSADSEITFDGADDLKRPGIAYILAVGINEYAHPQFNLHYAVDDARAFSDELRVQQTKIGAFSDVRVTLLENQDATKANILQALARFGGSQAGPLAEGFPKQLSKIETVQPEDAIFIYFAGHGAAPGKESDRFYLLAQDFEPQPDTPATRTAADEIFSGAINDRELASVIEKIDADYIVLVIDACQSGKTLESDDPRQGPMNSQGLAQLAYEKGMYILVAAQGDEAALELSQYGHGLLTYALVEEGLKQGKADYAPKDGQILLREWLDYTTLRLPELQTDGMKRMAALGRDISIVRGAQSRGVSPDDRDTQRPRVFYRRESDPQPILIAKP